MFGKFSDAWQCFIQLVSLCSCQMIDGCGGVALTCHFVGIPGFQLMLGEITFPPRAHHPWSPRLDGTVIGNMDLISSLKIPIGVTRCEWALSTAHVDMHHCTDIISDWFVPVTSTSSDRGPRRRCTQKVRNISFRAWHSR